MSTSMAPSKFETAAGLAIATDGDSCCLGGGGANALIGCRGGVGECGCDGRNGFCIVVCGECVRFGADVLVTVGGSIRLAIEGEADARFT